MARVTYRGPHPEPSFALPIPRAMGAGSLEVGLRQDDLWDEGMGGVGLQLAPGWGAGFGSHHNESVALPQGLTRRCSRWTALWLAGARRRTGPWVEVRLEPGEWAACVREVGRPFKAREVLRVTENTNILEVFQDSENRPMEIINDRGVWKYTPGTGLEQIEDYTRPLEPPVRYYRSDNDLNQGHRL